MSLCVVNCYNNSVNQHDIEETRSPMQLRSATAVADGITDGFSNENPPSVKRSTATGPSQTPNQNGQKRA